MISFEFKVGKTFVDYRNHPITVRTRFNSTMNEYMLGKSRYKASIACPDGKQISGHIYSSYNNGAHYYQITFHSKKTSPSIESLKVHNKLKVEIDKVKDEIIVTLHNVEPIPFDIPVETPSIAVDLEVPPDEPGRQPTLINRIIRDTQLALEIKRLYNYSCQLCGYIIEFENGKRYAEAHHIRPLGARHNGPDSRDNILCVCPNCHAKLDFGVIRLEPSKINNNSRQHPIRNEFIEYHNTNIYGKV
jgi:rubredoxin